MNESKIIDFLYNSKSNPFLKKTKLIIFFAKQSDESIISSIIKDIYSSASILKINNYFVCFISGKYDVDITNLFMTISFDLGYDIYVHDGIYVNKETTKEDILEYINIYNNAKKQIFMDIADVALNARKEDYFLFLDIVKRSNFSYIYKDLQTIDIIEALLKNNLNVLQTSKVLYLHRNSILNKIDTIYKETGLNVQKYTNAFLVKQIISNV